MLLPVNICYSRLFKAENSLKCSTVLHYKQLAINLGELFLLFFNYMLRYWSYSAGPMSIQSVSHFL